MLQKFYRKREVHTYLGMDRNRFDKEVRPYLTEIRIGIQGIAFERSELDRWAEYYMQRNGRPPRKEGLWHSEDRQD